MKREYEIKTLQQLQRQDHHAFNEFYSQSVDVFFRYLKSNYFLHDEEAEDLVSQFFVKLRESLPKLDTKKSFSAYVWTVFKNIVKDYFKKMSDLPFAYLEKTENDMDAMSFDEMIEDEADMTSILEQDFQFEQIQAAMQELDEISRDVIYFKYVEEKSYQEIGDLLTMSPDNARQKSSRALKQLKTLLET